MRANEFISESLKTKVPVDRDVAAPLVGAYVQPELRNNDAYRQYRYGVALAGARAIEQGLVKLTDESDFSGTLLHVGYTPEDEETIKKASKLMGVKNVKISDSTSYEASHTNTTSSVPKFKPNQYGV